MVLEDSTVNYPQTFSFLEKNDSTFLSSRQPLLLLQISTRKPDMSLPTFDGKTLCFDAPEQWDALQEILTDPNHPLIRSLHKVESLCLRSDLDPLYPEWQYSIVKGCAPYLPSVTQITVRGLYSSNREFNGEALRGYYTSLTALAFISCRIWTSSLYQLIWSLPTHTHLHLENVDTPGTEDSAAPEADARPAGPQLSSLVVIDCDCPGLFDLLIDDKHLAVRVSSLTWKPSWSSWDQILSPDPFFALVGDLVRLLKVQTDSSSLEQLEFNVHDEWPGMLF